MAGDKDKHLTMLKRFIEVYCAAHHEVGKEDALCEQCADLLDYAKTRLERCPYTSKPACKKCPTHCYKPLYRKQVREVMRFSGMHFVKRGRIDWLIKYFM